jgi:hypothetical protein
MRGGCQGRNKTFAAGRKRVTGFTENDHLYAAILLNLPESSPSPSVPSRWQISKYGLILSRFFLKNEDVRNVPRTEHRKQMTEDKEQTVF